MAGIPLPALDIKPQQQSDPLESYGRLVQLKSLLQNQQLQQQMQPLQMQQAQQAAQSGQLDLQQKQRAAQDQQTVMQVLSQNQGDLDRSLPQLAGKVSPQTFMGLAKAHLDMRKSVAELNEKELANQKQSNDSLLGLIEQAKQLPPDQYAQQWPNIAQQALQINPKLQGHIDPAQPVPQEALGQYEIGLQTQSVAQAQELKKREVTAQETTAQAHATQAARPTETSLALAATQGDRSAEAALKRLDQSKREARPVNNIMTSNDAKDIADAIASGDQPPTLQGLYRNAGPVRAELARRGVPLAKMETDWKATQRFMGSLNSTQQVRLRQAISTASDSLDKIEDLYNQLQAAAPTGGFKAWNRAVLTGAKQLPGKAGSLATNLDAQIADLTSELGNVYMGGNSPTDHSLSLAAKNLSGDWNKETFEDALKQARQNIQIRNNSIIHSQPVTGGGENMYAPQQPASTAPAPAKSAAPISLDEARAYLQKAGGDKDKARALAKADGRSF